MNGIALNNIPGVKQAIEEAKPHRLDPTTAAFRGIMEMLTEQLKINKNENILLYITASSHGYMYEGNQVVATNRYDPKINFHEFIPVEESVRNISAKHPNIYMFALFACCRAIFNGRKTEGILKFSMSRGAEETQISKFVQNFILIFGCRP